MRVKKFFGALIGMLLCFATVVSTAACSKTPSMTVTAEEWQTAFSAERFVNSKISVTFFIPAGVSYLEYVAADGVEYYHQTVVEGENIREDTSYSQRMENGYKMYEQQTNGWEISDYERSIFEVSGLSVMIEMFADNYESFTYDEAQNGYIFIVDETEMVVIFRCWFEEDTLSAWSYESIFILNESIDYTVYNVSVTFGGQQVEIPDLREA